MRAPTTAPAPIDDERADRHVRAQCARRAQWRSVGSIPRGGGALCVSRPTACANARYGSLAAQQRRRACLRTDASVETNDRRRARRGEMLVIFRVGDEREIAGLRLLDAGDAADLDVAVAFEAAVQPFSNSRSFNG